jgi:hypothetical protein
MAKALSATFILVVAVTRKSGIGDSRSFSGAKMFVQIQIEAYFAFKKVNR